MTQWIWDHPAQPRRLASKQNPAAVCLPDAEPLPGTFNIRVSAQLIVSIRLGAVLPSFHKINIFCFFFSAFQHPVGPVCGHRLRVRARPTFPTTARMSTRPLSQAGEGQTSQACPCWQTRARKGVRFFFSFSFLLSQLPVSAAAGTLSPRSRWALRPLASRVSHHPLGGQRKQWNALKKKNRNGSRSWGKKTKTTSPNAPYATVSSEGDAEAGILVWKQ